MRSKIFLLIVLASFWLVNSTRGQDAPGIKFFTGTLQEALAKAKQEKKLVFFDAYASWCGPCKNMKATVFTDATLGEFFNANFISIGIDMEKGEGPNLSKIFTSIDGYPSLLFLDAEGHVIKTLLGSRSIEALLGEARLAKMR